MLYIRGRHNDTLLDHHQWWWRIGDEIPNITECNCKVIKITADGEEIDYIIANTNFIYPENIEKTYWEWNEYSWYKYDDTAEELFNKLFKNSE